MMDDYVMSALDGLGDHSDEVGIPGDGLVHDSPVPNAEEVELDGVLERNLARAELAFAHHIDLQKQLERAKGLTTDSHTSTDTASAANCPAEESRRVESQLPLGATAEELPSHLPALALAAQAVDEVEVVTAQSRASRSVEENAEGLRITMKRIADSLDRLEIRYLTDGDGSLLAMWERHALLLALEGPDQEILVMRGRPHATVPPDWENRAYRVVNEWNHTRRFCKAYIGDLTERGQLPVYGEIQVPLLAGIHDALLDELVDCAAAVTSAFVDWLFDEGALL